MFLLWIGKDGFLECVRVGVETVSRCHGVIDGVSAYVFSLIIDKRCHSQTNFSM